MSNIKLLVAVHESGAGRKLDKFKVILIIIIFRIKISKRRLIYYIIQMYIIEVYKTSSTFNFIFKIFVVEDRSIYTISISLLSVRLSLPWLGFFLKQAFLHHT